MKLNFKAILFAAIATFMSVSCEEGIKDLSPTFDDVDATVVELSDVLYSDGERVKPYNYFTVKLGTAGATETSGIILEAVFVSNEQALHAATYAPAAKGSERKNTYVTGDTKVIVDGQAYPVVKGEIKVSLAEGAYALSGVVAVEVPAAEEGKVETAYYDLNWAGAALDFGVLPVKTDLTQLLIAQSNAMYMQKTVTVKMGTADITSQYGGYLLGGNGNYLAVDFYSADGYLAAGTYKPCTDTANPKEGEYVIGYDYPDYNMFNYGTCWWTVQNDVAEAQKISAGEITVEMSEDKVYTITIDNGVYYAVFTGAIPALTKPDKPAGGDKPQGSAVEELPKLLSCGSQDAYTQVVLQIGSEGVSATMDPTTYQTTYSGTGKILNITIHGEKDGDGVYYIPTGKYDAADGTTNPNTWQVTGGMGGYKWGTYLLDVVDGTATAIDITEGTIWIGAKGGQYIINAEVGGYKFRYTGPLQNVSCPADDDGGYVDSEGGEEGGETEYLDLTTFISYTDYFTMYANPLVGMELGTSGITVEYVDYGEYGVWPTTKGSGNVLKIEFYSADGKLEAGTYTASAENSPKAGEFGIGYDGQYGASGTTWYTYTDDQQTKNEKVVDGTATVEVDGDTYTITLESSLVNAKYVGKLSAN